MLDGTYLSRNFATLGPSSLTAAVWMEVRRRPKVWAKALTGKLLPESGEHFLMSFLMVVN